MENGQKKTEFVHFPHICASLYCIAMDSCVKGDLYGNGFFCCSCLYIFVWSGWYTGKVKIKWKLQIPYTKKTNIFLNLHKVNNIVDDERNFGYYVQ